MLRVRGRVCLYQVSKGCTACLDGNRNGSKRWTVRYLGMEGSALGEIDSWQADRALRLILGYLFHPFPFFESMFPKKGGNLLSATAPILMLSHAARPFHKAFRPFAEAS